MVVSNGGKLFYYSGTNGLGQFTVGGSLLMNGTSSVLHVFSGPTNTVRDYGILLAVTNDVSLTNGSWIYPYSDPTNGGSVLFTMNNLTISTNAGFKATALGYGGSTSETVRAWGPGAGLGRSGASHAGIGGTGASGSPGTTIYDTVTMPRMAGSSGGRGSASFPSSLGGGVVRIQVQNLVTVNGSILANGEDVSASSPSGGGSGGSIWINCRTFAGDSNGYLSARGGNTATGASWAGGSGGGGRIAVWRRFHAYLGSATATNGLYYPGYGGTTGTVVWVDIPAPGTIFTFR